MKRRTYPTEIVVNGRLINEVVIDSHYEKKHKDISDELILELVKYLDQKEFVPSEIEDEWEFFMLDKIEHRGKKYRLVWCMRENSLFIGIINAFRR